MALFASEIRALERRGYQTLARGQQWATTTLGFDPVSAYSLGKEFYGGLSMAIKDPKSFISGLPVLGEVMSVFGGGRTQPYFTDIMKQLRPEFTEKQIETAGSLFVRKFQIKHWTGRVVYDPTMGVTEEEIEYLQKRYGAKSRETAKRFWGAIKAWGKTPQLPTGVAYGATSRSVFQPRRPYGAFW